MVILADHILLAADVQPAEHFFQFPAQIGLVGELGLNIVGRFPAGNHLHGRQPAMDEIHIHVGDGFGLIKNMEFAGVGEGAEHGGLHIHLVAEVYEGVQFLRRHRQGHPFLGLGDEDLPGLEPGIL